VASSYPTRAPANVKMQHVNIPCAQGRSVWYSGCYSAVSLRWRTLQLRSFGVTELIHLPKGLLFESSKLYNNMILSYNEYRSTTFLL